MPSSAFIVASQIFHVTRIKREKIRSKFRTSNIHVYYQNNFKMLLILPTIPRNVAKWSMSFFNMTSLLVNAQLDALIKMFR